MGWIEKLGIPLILAAVSGLAFIAYKYPLGYKRIVVPIAFVTCTCFLCLLAGSLGAIHSDIKWLLSELKKSPEKEKSMFSFHITKLNKTWTFVNWTFVIFVIISGYLVFLYYLPNILGSGEQPTK